MVTLFKLYYERFTLVACLILSAILLGWLLLFILGSKIPDIPEIKNTPYKSSNSLLAIATPSTSEWQISPDYDPQKDYHLRSDLVRPLEISRCASCRYLIPTYDYKYTQKCPFCGIKLQPPPAKIDLNKDTDGDQIPDHVEKKLGLNFEDPSDGEQDLDGDGFSNRYEYLVSETDLNDPKSRPSLIEQLVLAKIEQQRIPLYFNNVATHNSEDKSQWFVFGRANDRKKVDIWQINSIIKTKHKYYKVIDINYKQIEKYNPHLKMPTMIDASEIVFTECTPKGDAIGKPIFAPVKKTVNHPDQLLSFRNKITEEHYNKLIPGQTLCLGNSKTGQETYKILQVDSTNKTVRAKKVDDNNNLTEPVYTIKSN